MSVLLLINRSDRPLTHMALLLLSPGASESRQDDNHPSKRPNRAISTSPVSSFTVANMALLDRHDRFLDHHVSRAQLPERELAPLPVNPQLESDTLNASNWTTPQDIFSSSDNSSPNQQRNINTMDVLPIERIRVELPTAAELAVSAFSDDEKSFHSNSSRGSQFSNGLLSIK